MAPPAAAGVVTVRRCHTAELTAAELAGARALMDAAFPDDFADQDWAHALGGTHAVAHLDGRLVAHGSLVRRRLWVGGTMLSCGYVEAVAVHPDYRRRGLGSAVMDALEALAPGYDLLALSATDEGAALYDRRDWRRWRGPSSAVGPAGLVRTQDDDGSIFVLVGVVPVDLDAPIACDWRAGDLW